MHTERRCRERFGEHACISVVVQRDSQMGEELEIQYTAVGMHVRACMVPRTCYNTYSGVLRNNKQQQQQ